MAESLTPSQAKTSSARVSLEAVGELVLLIIVGAFFIYLFVQSLSWPLGSALMPWIAVGIGAPFWLYRFGALLFQVKEDASQIMDVGFRTGDDHAGERKRFIRICGFIGGLYVAIWLFGFQIALPLGMLFYVKVYGEMSWGWAIGVGLFFLVLVVGVYDKLLGATWHEPVIYQWLGWTESF